MAETKTSVCRDWDVDNYCRDETRSSQDWDAETTTVIKWDMKPTLSIY